MAAVQAAAGRGCRLANRTMPRAEKAVTAIPALVNSVVSSNIVALRAISLATVNGQKGLGSTAQLLRIQWLAGLRAPRVGAAASTDGDSVMALCGDPKLIHERSMT
jgi:hypothetical protein